VVRRVYTPNIGGVKDGSVPAVNDEHQEALNGNPTHPSLAAFILIPGARVPGMPYRVRLNSIDGWSLGTMLEVADGSSIAIGLHEEGGA
jgi:hypothetical protein